MNSGNSGVTTVPRGSFSTMNSGGAGGGGSYAVQSFSGLVRDENLSFYAVSAFETITPNLGTTNPSLGQVPGLDTPGLYVSARASGAVVTFGSTTIQPSDPSRAEGGALVSSFALPDAAHVVGLSYIVGAVYASNANSFSQLVVSGTVNVTTHGKYLVKGEYISGDGRSLVLLTVEPNTIDKKLAIRELNRQSEGWTPVTNTRAR